MHWMLRTLVTLRGLILAGTLTLAIFGSSLDRGTNPPGTEVNSHRALPSDALTGQQVQPQWSIGDPCPPVSLVAVSDACGNGGTAGQR